MIKEKGHTNIAKQANEGKEKKTILLPAFE